MNSITAMKRLARVFYHMVKARRPDNSFAGEYEHLDAIMSSLAIAKGYLVDIAAGDGVNQSCTLGFLKREGWSGLAVEMDPVRFSSLAFVYSDFPTVELCRSRVTPHNIAPLLVGHEVPRDFTLLNLDIDSYDLHVANALLKAGFEPIVISMEINESIPPPIYFTVDYSESQFWQRDHFFGCSLTAAVETVRPHGYILESVNYNNATFIRSDHARGRYEDRSEGLAFDEGYRNKPDRRELFPWNADIECLLDYDTSRAIEYIQEQFVKYQGRYTLHGRSLKADP